MAGGFEGGITWGIAEGFVIVPVIPGFLSNSDKQENNSGEGTMKSTLDEGNIFINLPETCPVEKDLGRYNRLFERI